MSKKITSKTLIPNTIFEMDGKQCEDISDFYIAGYRQKAISLDNPISFETAVSIKKRASDFGNKCSFTKQGFKNNWSEIIFNEDRINILERLGTSLSIREVTISDITKSKWKLESFELRNNKRD
jgi:hypothetical protein